MKVLWTKSALDDLHQARAYMQSNSPGSMNETAQRIEKAVRFIGIDPMNGSKNWQIDGTRETPVTGTLFVLIHRMQGAKIHLLGILHNTRRWSDGA